MAAILEDLIAAFCWLAILAEVTLFAVAVVP